LTQTEIMELFRQKAEAASTDVRLAEDAAHLSEMIEKIVKDYDSVYRPRVTDVEKHIEFPDIKTVESPRDAPLCVQEAFAAVAETGSLVHASHTGKPLEAGLLVDHHVAVIRKDRIHRDLESLFNDLGPDLPSAVVFETGPSRTADIELTLTIGVHGPERLTVIILETQRASAE
jgi:L-lactate dehydrogenase complex protein LldG